MDHDDVLNIVSGGPSQEIPTNGNSRNALLCVTDLVDCCATPHTVRGDWYFPDGRRVGFDTGFSAAYLANRGVNEETFGQTVYGSVRLYRRFSGSSDRGRFRCELPSAANPSVNQTLYVNICEFIT